jgi:hypothetical protein
MYPHDWKRFLAEGAGNEIAIAQLSTEMTDHLGALSNRVFYHHDYVMKAVNKHGMLVEHFPLVFDTVERGKALADRAAHITFLHFDEAFNRWFQVTVKRAFETKRIYVQTFYKTNVREVTRKVKRFPVLRE